LLPDEALKPYPFSSTLIELLPLVIFTTLLAYLIHYQEFLFRLHKDFIFSKGETFQHQPQLLTAYSQNQLSLRQRTEKP
jgi:hypothetical protein